MDPCTDFEEYVCGGWEENHRSVGDSASDAIALIAEKTLQILKYILDHDYNGQNDVSFVRFIRVSISENFRYLMQVNTGSKYSSYSRVASEE